MIIRRLLMKLYKLHKIKGVYISYYALVILVVSKI
jgi:hypothetical protein